MTRFFEKPPLEKLEQEVYIAAFASKNVRGLIKDIETLVNPNFDRIELYMGEVAKNVLNSEFCGEITGGYIATKGANDDYDKKVRLLLEEIYFAAVQSPSVRRQLKEIQGYSLLEIVRDHKMQIPLDDLVGRLQKSYTPSVPYSKIQGQAKPLNLKATFNHPVKQLEVLIDERAQKLKKDNFESGDFLLSNCYPDEFRR